MIDDDVKTKYQNPQYSLKGNLCEAFNNTIRPPAWPQDICTLDDKEGGLGFENFDFMVWMQTAALPKFRKIYRQLDTRNETFRDGLPPGTYVLYINFSRFCRS